MTTFDKHTVTVTVTNNQTAHVESFTLSVGIHQGAFNEMSHELMYTLKDWIRPGRPTPCNEDS